MDFLVGQYINMIKKHKAVGNVYLHLMEITDVLLGLKTTTTITTIKPQLSGWRFKNDV